MANPALSLNSYFEAYEKPTSHMFEKEENKQHYDYMVEDYQHVQPKRHILGLVGGNDSYDINILTYWQHQEYYQYGH